MTYVLTLLLTILLPAVLPLGTQAGDAMRVQVNRVGLNLTAGIQMFDDRASFLSRPYLQSMLDLEFRVYLDTGRDADIQTALKTWHGRNKSMTEVQAEQAFVDVFFVKLWGNGLSGAGHEDEHTIFPKYAIAAGGAGGNKGAADLALGWFRGGNEAVPQVLCEFKDIRSKLDVKQNRKGANMSPVEQCLNYVKAARRHTLGNEPVQSWWGLVTDMNEFRLYWWDTAPQNYMRFVISGEKDLFNSYDLLSDGEDAAFDRFLFSKLLHRDSLISLSGRPALWRLMERQGRKEHEIEEEFYGHYTGFRNRLFDTLKIWNRDFPGTQTELLRISQRLLDRFIFAFYCEDMGERMLFPPQFIRDMLVDRSKNDYYESEGTDIWDWMKRLFHFMNKGGKFGQRDVPMINGGLFEDNPLINNLIIPNFVFAAPGQGLNEASLSKKKDTLLFLSGYYNYAAKGDATQSLTLYTLGRIFEQSITELEYRVGEIEGRETVAKLSKRKRDGVYYTPEWVVNYLVQQTMGPWFREAREAAGWRDDDANPSAEALKTYLAKLRSIKVIDPACGSGAFMISAFRALRDERKTVATVMQQRALKDDGGIGDNEEKIVADILRNNIYGVDINPASVEIAKLAMWLHSARARAPLSSLDGNIVCGNSLVASDVWSMVKQTPETEARINPFDWQGSFAEGSFDIVLGNPPYVKLQYLVKTDPDVVEYLRMPRELGAYASTTVGNFDLYIPFMEKGLRLLRENGRMAYIAPSLWTINKYGSPIRSLIKQNRQLERWLDFRSFQVFSDVTTYVALQFFTKKKNERVFLASSPTGEIGDNDWTEDSSSVTFEELHDDEPWQLLSSREKEIMSATFKLSERLDDPSNTREIFQGVKTGADPIYKLTRRGKNEYFCDPSEGEPFNVTLEDALLHPILSGDETKRYIVPETNTYLLFPYEKQDGRTELVSLPRMESTFPNAWKYLNQWRSDLEKRDNGDLKGEDWYKFSRSQSLDKLGVPKLVAAGTVPSLRFAFDERGDFFLTGGRVDGVVPSSEVDPFYILGVLNGNAADYVFRRIGRPKLHEFFEANKQFIAPLPVPRATPEQQAAIGARARRLQEMWTGRRSLISEVEARLSVLPRARFKEKFLWTDLPDPRKQPLPRNLKETEQAKWLKDRHEEEIGKRLDALQGFLDTRAELTAQFKSGELRLLSDGRPVLQGIFLKDDEGSLVAQYWRYVISQRMGEAKTFARALGSYPSPDGNDAARQFMQRVDALLALNASILAEERDMNEALYALYGLSTDERQLIEDDCAKRPLL